MSEGRTPPPAKRVFAGSCIGVALVLGLGAADAAADMGWRNDGTGRYPDANPPLVWSQTDNVIWKTPTKDWSNATPVLAKGRIVIQQEPSTLLCLDAKTGKLNWEADNSYQAVLPPEQAKDPRMPPTYAGVNGYSSPTPVIFKKRIYALFGTGVAACYDLDGTRIWARLVERPANGWGHSASPVVAQDRLMVHINGTVHGLNLKTGETLWTAQSPSTWGTPVAFEAGDDMAILTTGSMVIRCRDGKVLAKGVGALPWTSPIYDEGVLYLVDEAGAFAYRVSPPKNDEMILEKLWQSRPRQDRYYASPLIHEGLIYAINQSAWLSVLDAATGAVVYERHLDLPGTVYPSVCLADGKLFFSSEGGRTIVLEPGRVYKELAVNNLEAFRATPVFDGKRVYIRTLNALYCIGK